MAGGLFALSRADLATLAADALSHSIGRKVTIRSLAVRLGRTTHVELRGVTLANMQGGSQPEMVSLASLTAEVEPWTLLFGPMVVHRLSVDGAFLLLEHGPDDKANWRFGPAIRILPKPESRRVMPTLLDARFHNVAIDIRTSGGTTLRARIDDGTVAAMTPDSPVSVKVTGSYNGIAMHGDVTLPAFNDLHGGAKNFPVRFKFDSGTTSLAFVGTAVDPLNADGLSGRMTLNAPNPREVMALAGFVGKLDLPLTLSSLFSRKDTLWQLADGEGTLGGDPFKATFKMQEGKRHQPDAIALDAGFSKLDIDAMAPSGTAPPPGATSLLIDPAPGVLVDAHIAADRLTYRTILGEEFDLKAKLAAGSLSIEQIALNIAGGSAHSKIVVTNHDNRGTVTFDGALAGVDVNKVAKLMGWGPLPVGGLLSSRVSGDMTGATLTEARGANNIFAVLSMDDGTFDRHLVRMASTDIRAIFGSTNEVSRLSCLIAVMRLKDGKGTIAPVKIKTADGTIVGGGLYDARHDSIDMTIGTQSKTTSFFALDVPVRISGPLSDFSVRPVFGRTAPLDSGGDIGNLPVPMQAFAASNPCAAR